MPDDVVVYLAEDHELVRRGIESVILSLDLVKDVKTYANGKELYKAILNQKPTCIFLDIEMPEWDGFRTLKEVNRSFPQIPCLMLSMLEERSVIEECMNLGASGYLHKDSSKDELEAAIKSVLSGKPYFSQEAGKILSGRRNKSTSASFELTEPLTERELEILTKICDGLTSKEIGEALFVSHRTVETHKKNLMHKFNVNSTGKLIALAFKNRIVQ